jgi:peptidoglycan/LPS O-acetylase OafA/YrhL
MQGTHRPEIDGLRAVAVAAVLIGHTGLGVVRGGFIGVDVFFVISGYLITQNILRDLSLNRFGFRRFYIRRACRILPALFAMLMVAVPLGLVIYPSDTAHEVLGMIIAAALSVSNVLLATDTALNLSAGQAPLLHTWSLGVEEQFYILFPILLVAAHRFGTSAQIAAVSLVGLVSFAWAYAATRDYDHSEHYMPQLRAWELMAGAILAQCEARIRLSRRFAAIIGGVGAVVVLATTILLPSRVATFPGPIALLPVLGTVGLILACREDIVLRRVLSLRPLVGLGLMSYSVYLWHWPIFEAYRHLTGAGFNLGLQAAAILTALSFGIAWLSWRFVEQPFRNLSGTMSRRSAYLAGAGPLIATLSAAFLLFGR